MGALRAKDFQLAADVRRELGRQNLTVTKLQELACELLPVFDSENVSITLTDPNRTSESGVSFWILHGAADDFVKIVRECPEGNLAVRLLRRSGRRTARFSDLDAAGRTRFFASQFYRDFQDWTGMEHILVAHLGTRPQESVGRLAYYRENGHTDFDEERVSLLWTLHESFSTAARNLVTTNLSDDAEEVAMLDSAGQVLWMTDGFRFLWNASEKVRFGYGTLAAHELLAGTPLGRTTAFQIIALAMPSPSYHPSDLIEVPYRDGRGILQGRFEKVSGDMYGSRDHLVRVTLRRVLPTPSE